MSGLHNSDSWQSGRVGVSFEIQMIQMKLALAWFTLIFALLFSVSCASSKEDSSGSVSEVEEVKKEVEEMKEEVARKRIVFFGNSITAGYNLNPESAFPNLLQKKLDSLDYAYEVVNAGLSGETTSAGVQRLDWMLKGDVDIFALELGANDGLRGLPLSETKQNLLKMIDAVRKVNPQVKILLLGMEVPPNMGDEYAAEFRSVFRDVASEKQVHFIPFLLKGVAGIKELNLEDGIHPTEEGHRILADNVWQVLEELL